MATASARLSEAGRRKRAELCARQRQRGPAPLASFEDISVDRSVDCSMERSVDLDIEGGGVMAKAAPAEINCQKLALPAVSIQVSKASSSASEGSRATTPEADGGFQEEVGELRGATDELGAPHMSPVPAPGSFEVDDLVDISHLPSETASLHTDTDSSGRQSQDGCVCRCHSDTDDQDTDRRQEELRERLSVVSGSSSSSGPPTCTERPPPDRAELNRSGDTEYLLAQPPAPFGMDLDVPSNRSSRVISPPPVRIGNVWGLS
ncbi:hypothetical protein FJT64_020562 [Amphibalanus amphitrite]|uniref:Uncharacterized protein n=1 Tax=Amphibalanus amphitrite TaxID=1232801 RepID=A0A6A4WQ68_AMPAM|nr:hypothetical protein FJT64_020562 [Amphibalanus amphitrite]